VDTETGELGEQRLIHPKEAEQFYGEPKERNIAVRVGMEASGHARWFERLLRQLQFELWIGDAAEIRTKGVRKQKTDRQDAQLLLRLIMEDRFPRIWVADAENRDLRQLLWHRHRLVQMRTRVMNQLHVVALNEGLRRRKGLWRPGGRKELELIALAPWAGRRREDLLEPSGKIRTGSDTQRPAAAAGARTLCPLFECRHRQCEADGKAHRNSRRTERWPRGAAGCARRSPEVRCPGRDDS